MPVSVPPQSALAEYLGPTTRHTRRVEIYESDGATRWEKDNVVRLKSGSVTVDYDRDERRALDLTLSNDDGALINAPGEFWYDKIIKVFRGVKVDEKTHTPAILVIAEPTGADLAAIAFRAALVGIGFGNVQVNTSVSSLLDFVGYDVLINLNNDDPNVISLLKQAYTSGYRVLSMGFGNVATYGDLFKTPAPTAGTVEANARTAFAATGGHPVAKGWAPISYESFSRINEFMDPTARNATLNLSWSTGRWFGGGTGNGTYTNVTVADGPIPEITTVKRKTWTAAATQTGDTGFELRHPTTTRFAVKPGQTVVMSYWMRAKSTTPKTFYARLGWFSVSSGGTSLSYSNGSTVQVAANDYTWKYVSVTATAPHGATHLWPLADIAAGTGHSWAVNDYLDVTGVMIQYGTTDPTSPILKRNLVQNPSPETSTSNWGVLAGTGGAAGGARVASAGYQSGYAYRTTWTTANTVIGGGAYVANVPVEAGKVYSFAAYGRITTGAAQGMRLQIEWKKADNTTISLSYGSAANIAAATWIRFATNNHTAPALAAKATVAIYAVSGQTNSRLWAVNDVFDADSFIVEQAAATTSYFDGDWFGASWEGTAYGSSSVLRAVTTPVAGDFFDGYQYGSYWEGTVDNSRSIEGFKETSVLASSIPASAGATSLAVDASGDAVISAFSTPDLDRRWVMWHPTMPSRILEQTNIRGFLASALNWLNPVRPLTEWEVQIGEFMIDRISESNFPYEVRITGRDYTKKCMSSKFAYATQFVEGITLESIIGMIAGAAGISKRSLPDTGIVVGRGFFFERGTSRWDAMKEIANAYNYEIYFDAAGFLVIRPFRDPVTTPPIVYLETGKQGQLASYEKSTSDTRLFNHIMIIGESSDSEIPNVWTELINEDPNSPTSVMAIGDRYFEYSSAFIETQAQADELAATYMAIMSLEEFELSFDSLMLPWLEVGDIIGWIDPRPAPDDPSTFLLSSLTLPLALGPMSGSAKRVTIVGN